MLPFVPISLYLKAVHYVEFWLRTLYCKKGQSMSRKRSALIQFFMFSMRVYNYKQEIRCKLARIYIGSTKMNLTKLPAGRYLRARSNLFIVIHVE